MLESMNKLNKILYPKKILHHAFRLKFQYDHLIVVFKFFLTSRIESNHEHCTKVGEHGCLEVCPTPMSGMY